MVVSVRLLGSACALSLIACQRQPVDNKPRASATAAATIVSVAPPPTTAAAAEKKPTAEELEAPLHLPAKLPASQKAPLLVMLHGLGSSAPMIERLSEWPSFAEQRGVAWMAPNGPLDRQGRRFWDAGPSCCNFDEAKVDHVAALHGVVERALASGRVDHDRVFVGGYSNGGFMAHRLACERPELIRGVVSVAGSGPLDRSSCKPPVSLRVLQVQGDADPIVTYGGGHLFKDPKLPQHISARKTAEDWAASLGCRSEPVDLEPVDFESGIAGPETKRQRFVDCKLGRVELWTVVGGGHYVGFRSPAPDAIWKFLSE